IYADKASLVGSIGVVGSGFGFTGVMEKLGVERRQYTAGENKAFLDPFQPENPKHKAFWEEVLKVTHRQFIEQVKLGRGDRLTDHPDLFSGLVWSGEQALELGLIDGLGSSCQVAREQMGTEELVNFTYQPSPWDELVRMLGASVGQGLAASLLQQSLTLRYLILTRGHCVPIMSRTMAEAQLPKRVDAVKLVDNNQQLNADIDSKNLTRLLDAVVHCNEPVHCEIQFERDQDKNRMLTGSCNTNVVMICQRCLGEVSLPVTSRFQLGLVFDDDQARQLPKRLEPVELDENGQLDLW